jgi:hypothetical protein
MMLRLLQDATMSLGPTDYKGLRCDDNKASHFWTC